MLIFNTDKELLVTLKDISIASEVCSTKTYIWAGLVPDIVQGEHHSIDGFTNNLLGKRNELFNQYRSKGFKETFDEYYSTLKIDRNGIHASFNPLDIENDIAMWQHIGDHGTLYFPKC